jgi:RecA-family ATPase
MTDLEQLKRSISIVELAKLYGAEPKRESGRAIPCRHNPLREEKTSSLFLYADTNTWSDMGDRSGGSVIDFVMQADGLSVSEAIKKLENMSGIEPRTVPAYTPERSFTAPNVIMKIWNMQKEISMDNGRDELLAIAPEYVFNETDDESLKRFFDVVKLEKQTHVAFVLLRDTMGEPRSIRYRRYTKKDDLTGEAEEKKWYALPGTQTNFPYVSIINDDDFVLIVEGTHDYVSAVLAGYNVIALPHANHKLDQELIKNRICIFMDDDDGKDSMRALFDEAACAKVWFDHSQFKKKHRIKKAKDFSDYLECFKSLEEFKQAINDQVDMLEHAEHTTPANRLLCFADLTDDIVPPSWMVQGVIPQEGLIEIIGGSGSYKSFLLLDMMFCISAGIDYHGREVKPGVCVYVAGEGKSGAILRVRALEKHYGIKNRNFYILPFPANMVDKDEMDLLASDIKAISDEPVSMMMFDTLHRNSAGANEDKSDDFAKILGILDTYIRPSAKVIGYVHHTGNSPEAKTRGRGTSSRFAAMDTSIVIMSSEPQTAVMSCEKQKDGERFAPMGFKLNKIDIELQDEYGEALFNLVPEASDEVNIEQKADKEKSDSCDVEQLKEDTYAFIAENDGCVAADIKKHLKGQYPRNKIDECIKAHKGELWRFTKGEKNSWLMHAILKKDEATGASQVYEYKMDTADLF